MSENDGLFDFAGFDNTDDNAMIDFINTMIDEINGGEDE